MPTVAEALSQKIFEIPDHVRKHNVTLNFDRVSIIPILASVIFIVDTIQDENPDSLISLFANDRFDYIRDVVMGADEVISTLHNDTEVDDIEITLDVDGMTLMRYSCEYSLENKEKFLEKSGLNGIEQETKDFLFNIINQGAVKTTDAITKIILNYN